MIPATPGEVLRSLAFYAVFYGGSVPLVTWAVAMLLVGERPFIAAAAGWSGWHRWCANNILGIEVRIEGAMPGPDTLVVLKHESFFEAIDLPTLLDRPVVFTKAELFRIPGWGLAARRFGLVAVERDQGAKALRAMISAARVIAVERPLALFAEGTRVPHGSKPPLQAGFAGLYKLIGRPVVPVAVNSGELYHRTWKRRGTIIYRFAEPVPAGLSREEAEARVHAAMNALN
ncbi:MAG: lysophospholipid acyltransferase family protein [Novosphingobium sp.]